MAAAFFRSLPRWRRPLPISPGLPVQLTRPAPPPTRTQTTLITTTGLFRRPHHSPTSNARPPPSSRSFSSLPPAIHDQSSSSLGSHYFRLIRSKFKDERFARRALAAAGVAAVVAWNFETVPYSSRWHLILLTSGLERRLGEMAFEDTKNAKHRVLPSTDARSVKVRRIARKILKSMEEELGGGRHDQAQALEGDPVGGGCSSRRAGQCVLSTRW